MTGKITFGQIIRIVGVLGILALSLSVFVLQMLWYYLINSYMWYAYYCLYFFCIGLIVYSLTRDKAKRRYGFLALMAIVVGWIPYEILIVEILKAVFNSGNEELVLSGMTEGLPRALRLFIEAIFYPSLQFLLFVLLSLLFARDSSESC